MSAITLFILSSVLFAVSIILFMVFLGLWTYKDAKVKSDHSPVLWVLVVLLVPNMLGILIYLLVGRNKKDVPAPGTFFKPMITFVVIFILSIFLFVGSTVWVTLDDTTVFGGGMTLNTGVWGGHSSRYANGEWAVSTRSGNGTMRRTHELDETQLSNFTVQSSNSEGRLYLELQQGDTNYTMELTGQVMGDIDLTAQGFEPGRIRMTLRFVNARDVSTVIRWS